MIMAMPWIVGGRTPFPLRVVGRFEGPLWVVSRRSEAQQFNSSVAPNLAIQTSEATLLEATLLYAVVPPTCNFATLDVSSSLARRARRHPINH